MLKIFKYYYYYIFFNAYWASYDLGEKDLPRQNAIYYMSVIKILLIGLLYNIIKLYVEDLSVLAFIGLGSIIVFLVDHLLFSKKNVDANYTKYLFIKDSKKSKRQILFWSLFITPAMLILLFAGIKSIID